MEDSDSSSSFSTWFKAPRADLQSIESRAKEIMRKLKFLAQAIDMIGLKPGDGEKLPQRSPSTSLVDESCVFGRDEVKEEMIKRLLSDNVSTNRIDVISIVGMGGAGKTTLAQLLYNDARMKERFDLKAWVCVSEEFLLVRVTKLILEEIGSQTSSDSLNLLQLKLRESLADKRFLLVLDDVWKKGCSSEWDQLRIPLLAAGEGSKIVVTTRDTDVAKIMSAAHTHPLEGLSRADYSSPYPLLESIGRAIVAKCQGLPLGVKAIGSLLYSKVDRREWEETLESEIWDFKICGILPSLILSYQDLPFHLKRCFAYCSIFPKNHEFNRETLILLWMAEGLLQFSKSNKRMSKVGEQYFDELLSKSFLQKSVFNESWFVMHDLMHDLAQYIFREFCIGFEDDKVQEISVNTRHSSNFISNYDGIVTFKRFEDLAKIKYLRTYLELRAMQWNIYQLSKRVDLHTILSKWRYLRVLSLHSYVLIELPDSIGELKYLRYLDISHTKIKKLPDSVCYLYNLQTMILSGDSRFIELPSRMDKLINLRFLDISGWREMPSHISRLKNLQKLSNFIVGKKGGLRIGELGELSDIGGRLEISEMQNVVCARDALGANMKNKRHLDELSLTWSDVDTNDLIRSGILNNLQPHPNLKQLIINGYPGITFPDWIGDPLFSNLVSVYLYWCGNCSSLPMFGQLPSLKHLSIKGMKGVERVGSEFYEDASSSITSKPSFPFLQSLRFEHMYNWKKWLCCGCEFRRLRELYLIRCPKLTGKLPEELPSLKKLEIEGCWGLLVASLQVPAIRELKMLGFGELQLKRPASGFAALQTSDIEILNVSQWKQLPLEPHRLTIRGLHAVECERLLVASLQVPAIRELKMLGFGELQLKRPASGFAALQTSDIEISNVSQCKQLPLEPHKLQITDPDAVEFLLEEGILQTRTSPMQYLKIYGCRFSRYLHKVCLPTTLKSLEIRVCYNLRFLLAELFRCHHPSLEDLTILSSDDLSCSPYLSLSFSLAIFPRLIHFRIDGYEGLKYLCISISEKEPTSLRSLEIFGCDDLEFIEFPALDSACYRIVECSNLKWVGHTLSSLKRLSLEDCPQLLFHKDGLPSNLRQLEICTCDQLTPQVDWGLQRLASLTEFKIRGGCQDVESFPEELLLPSTLTTLEIKDFPNLKSLDSRGLQQLTSLRKLSIRCCPQLQFIPQEGFQHFPFLLELEMEDCPKLQSLKEAETSRFPLFLDIQDCPLLEQRCQFEEGQEWDYIAHIPQIFICDEVL
ncbi:hypothetical protein AAG906_022808 [Vitis piasezkii]